MTRRSSTSRRDLRATGATRRPGPWASVLNLLPKAALVGVLGAATIAVPLAHADGGDGEGGQRSRAQLPTALEVLSDARSVDTRTSLLAAPESRAAEVAASRSLEREALPGCDGVARTDGSNGQLDDDSLCTLWDGEHRLRADAAVALTELNTAFNAAFGKDLCITDSYRTLASQYRLARTKPGLAATPGKSNHGWGLAIDFCPSVYNNAEVDAWVEANGPVFGWVNPGWAKMNNYEPWHWEYASGTSEMGSNWDER